jgi:hypothetical protein
VGSISVLDCQLLSNRVSHFSGKHNNNNGCTCGDTGSKVASYAFFDVGLDLGLAPRSRTRHPSPTRAWTDKILIRFPRIKVRHPSSQADLHTLTWSPSPVQSVNPLLQPNSNQPCPLFLSRLLSPGPCFVALPISGRKCYLCMCSSCPSAVTTAPPSPVQARLVNP